MERLALLIGILVALTLHGFLLLLPLSEDTGNPIGRRRKSFTLALLHTPAKEDLSSVREETRSAPDQVSPVQSTASDPEPKNAPPVLTPGPGQDTVQKPEAAPAPVIDLYDAPSARLPYLQPPQSLTEEEQVAQVIDGSTRRIRKDPLPEVTEALEDTRRRMASWFFPSTGPLIRAGLGEFPVSGGFLAPSVPPPDTPHRLEMHRVAQGGPYAFTPSMVLGFGGGEARKNPTLMAIAEVEHDDEGRPDHWSIFRSSGDQGFDREVIAAIQDAAKAPSNEILARDRKPRWSRWEFSATAYQASLIKNVRLVAVAYQK